MKNFIHILILFLLTNITVFSQSQSPAPATEQTKQIVSKNLNFTLNLPEKWEIMDQDLGLDLIALAPVLNPKDLFRDNLNIISVKLDVPITQEEYYQYNLESLRELLEDFDLESSKDVTIGGFPARQFIFTHTVGPVNVKVIQYLALLGNHAYVITFTAASLDFERIHPQFEQIAESIQFKPES